MRVRVSGSLGFLLRMASWVVVLIGWLFLVQGVRKVGGQGRDCVWCCVIEIGAGVIERKEWARMKKAGGERK